MRKYKYIIGLVTYLGFIIANILLWVTYGRATVFLTMAFYITLVLLAFSLLQILQKYLSNELRLNLKVLIITSLIGLFTGELILRFVIGIHLNYSEQNGSFFYISPYANARRMVERSDNYLLEYKVGLTRWEEKDEFRFRHIYNELGMRERTLSTLPSSKDTLIVLGLGDSFTEGVGTSQDSTWLRTLERSVNQDTALKPIFTINGGESGSDPFFEYEKLKYWSTSFSPDVVILAANISDLDDGFIRGGLERFERPNPYLRPDIAPWWEPFYAGSMYVRHLVHLRGDFHMLLLSYDALNQEREIVVNKMVKLIEAYQKLALEKAFTFVLILHPTYDELLNNAFALQPLANKLEGKSNLVLLNLFEHFQEHQLINKDNFLTFYWLKDKHHNATGYTLWGIELKKILQAKDFFN